MAREEASRDRSVAFWEYCSHFKCTQILQSNFSLNTHTHTHTHRVIELQGCISVLIMDSQQ